MHVRDDGCLFESRDRLDVTQQSSTSYIHTKQQQKQLTLAVGFDVGDSVGLVVGLCVAIYKSIEDNIRLKVRMKKKRRVCIT